MIAKLEALKRLLLKEWDPIGVGDAAGAQDEYDSYAFELFVMLSRRAQVGDVAAYLAWVEGSHMAMPLHAGRNRAIAERAVALFEGDDAP